MQPNEKPQQPPQKLIDFNEELEALCKKYQYELKAVLMSDLHGIYARLQAFDISPKTQVADGVQLKPKQKVVDAPEGSDKKEEVKIEEASTEAPIDNSVKN